MKSIEKYGYFNMTSKQCGRPTKLIPITNYHCDYSFSCYEVIYKTATCF